MTYFEFTNIKKGTYFISVSKKGYKRYKKKLEFEKCDSKEVEVLLKDKFIKHGFASQKIRVYRRVYQAG